MEILAQNTRAVNSAAQPPKVQLSNVLLPARLRWVLGQIESILKRNLKITFPDRILAQIGKYRSSANHDYFALNC